MEDANTTASAAPARLVRAPQDFIAGLFLIALGTFALWKNSGLTLGTLRAFGPGMLPAILSGLCILFGLLIIFFSLRSDGPALERWSWRGPLFVLGGAVAFGLTIRPLGLVVAAPLAVIISAFASDETKMGESLIFGVGMTVFCLGLFKFMLGLPVPVAPFLLGY